MMSRPKYIAEGFHEDASKLLNEFLDLNSVEFPDFATIWRKHHFSLVFMGRPDDAEMTEFVNEIFKISNQFLVSSSSNQQVGAVFLLYALFRNQISDPPIKIRLEINQWRIIKLLREEAIVKKYRTLHYVIDYLMKNAFLYVANQTLKGPLIGCMQKMSKNEEIVFNLKTSYKTDIMQYNITNNLTVLKDLQAQYLEEKKKIIHVAKVYLNDNSDTYQKLIDNLHDLMDQREVKKVDNLGTRRAKIKAESFTRKSKDRFGRISDHDDESDNDPDVDYGAPVKKKIHYRRPRRAPKHERRVGRPSKKPKKEPEEPKSDDDVDISHLLAQQKDFFLPPVNSEAKKSRSKRDPYYQVSPKREENDSDPDIVS